MQRQRGFLNSLTLHSCHTLMTHLCFAQLARHMSLLPTCEKWILWIWKVTHWNYHLTSCLMNSDKLIEQVHCIEISYVWGLQKVLIRLATVKYKLKLIRFLKYVSFSHWWEIPHLICKFFIFLFFIPSLVSS